MNRNYEIGGLVPFKDMAKRLLEIGKSKQEVTEFFTHLLEHAFSRTEEIKQTIEWLEAQK